MQKTLKTFRRYHDYDYSRGAAVFLTFHLAPRICVFGEITPDGIMHLSEAGRLLEDTILQENARNKSVSIMRYQIMPEHLHLRIYLHPMLNAPLDEMGHFVQNIKRWSAWKISKLGMRITWQENYHDRICLNREIIDRVDEYIALNPQKWALMHTPNPPMKVIEPIVSPLLNPEEWWTGVGNVSLLSGEYPLASIRLSRKLKAQEGNGIITWLLGECRAGLIPISTFISPLEQSLYALLIQNGFAMIRVVPDALKTIYRPDVEETPLFADNRIMLLSCQMNSLTTREQKWHYLNDSIAQMAERSGGKAYYYTSAL